MAVNVKATYKNIPQQTIGPFTATLEYFESSGITFDAGKVNNITGGTSTGVIETLNIGPTNTILKTDLTHQQLINGFTFTQIKCGDTFITFQSTDVCYSSYQANLVGANGFPTARLTVYNNDSTAVSGTLTITPLNGAASPVPSTISVSRPTSGSSFADIMLGKGKYNFTFDITTASPNAGKYVELSFIECGGL
jgi:hypothetical protein